MRITVRVWQTALFVTVIVVAMLILTTSLLAGLGRSIRNLGREEQLKDAAVIADSLSPYFPVTVESRAVLREEVRRVHNVFGDDVWVFDLDGVRIHHEGGMDAPPDNLEAAFAAGLADSPPYADVDLAEEGLAVAATAIYDDNGRRTGVVVVAEPTADARAVLDEAARQLRVASWIALAVAGLLGFAFSDFIARRVKMLTRAASAIADGDFQQRLPKGLVPDEIRELADVYNRMAVQLGQAFGSIREHEREISAVVESLAEGVLALDEGGVVRLVNPASERILRMKAVDLIGQSIENAVVDEQVTSLARSGLAGRHAVETVALGNTILLVHATPIEDEGGVDGTVLLLADVTEQKRYEEAQRRFIANASHEMRTPISALKGFIELLESGAKEKTEVRDDFLLTMEAEVERLSRLVSDLFTLAQIDAGRMELEIEPVRVRTLFEDVVKLMSLLAEEAEVTLDTDLVGDNLAVLCDRHRVLQVLVGFVDNALKHSRPRDHVSLHAAKRDSSVALEVSDTGPGIPPDAQSRIFERFYRGSASGEPGKGAGLGLSIAAEIVQAHGSEIEVESGPDAGATFRFSLPSA